MTSIHPSIHPSIHLLIPLVFSFAILLPDGISQAIFMTGDAAYVTTYSVPGSSTYCYVIPSGIGIPNVNINVQNFNTGNSFTDVTDVNGIFEGYIPTGTIGITLSKDCADADYACWINGVSTYDLVLIRRHILDEEKIGCPFRRIAADANNSGTVTTADQVLLQSLILGNIQSLPDVPAWRFVSTKYTGWINNPDPNFPLVFWNMQSYPVNAYPFSALYHYGPSTYSYLGAATWVDILNEWELTLGNFDSWSFGGLKMGDINGSVNLSQFQGEEVEDRTLFISYSDKEMKAKEGEEFLVQVRAKNFMELAAYQLGLWLDPGKVELMEVKEGNLPGISKENFGLTHTDKGELRTLWLEPAGKILSKENSILFTLHIRAKAPIYNISDFLALRDQVLDNEFYHPDGSLAQVDLDFEIQRFPSPGELTFETTEIFPNPFREETTLAFDLPLEAEVKITVRNSWGKILATYQRLFEEGYNEFVLGRNLPQGVLFYSIEGGSLSVNGKMVKTN